MGISSKLLLIMSLPVNQHTMKQAHKEFNSLIDKFAAKFKQLDLREFGAVGTPAFNDKPNELTVLFAHMSQPCQELNLPILAHLHRPPFFKY